jgi:hypothetical protein
MAEVAVPPTEPFSVAVPLPQTSISDPALAVAEGSIVIVDDAVAAAQPPAAAISLVIV